MRFTLPLFSLLLTIGAMSAQAATVTVLDRAFEPAALHAPDSTEGRVNVGIVGSVPEVGADAWRGSPFAGVAPYISINGASSATYLMNGASTEIMFRWGSPDRFNGIDFLMGDRIVDAVVGRGGLGDVSEYPAYSTDDYFVSVTTEAAFDAVRFTSRVNSFEFAQIQPSAVPLPASAVLLIGGLGAIGAVRRRRG